MCKRFHECLACDMANIFAFQHAKKTYAIENDNFAI